jgi:preprotein translocase subunit SecE
VNTFLKSIFDASIYKRNQGRVTRQITFAAVVLGAGAGLYRFGQFSTGLSNELRYGIPSVLFLIVAWLAYRLVNMPAFADFLIAVEAEMNKVSWPTRNELFRASAVVLITMMILTAALWVFDTIWQIVFRGLGILG